VLDRKKALYKNKITDYDQLTLDVYVGLVDEAGVVPFGFFIEVGRLDGVQGLPEDEDHLLVTKAGVTAVVEEREVRFDGDHRGVLLAFAQEALRPQRSVVINAPSKHACCKEII
jgi:hypothetical protein